MSALQTATPSRNATVSSADTADASSPGSSTNGYRWTRVDAGCARPLHLLRSEASSIYRINIPAPLFQDRPNTKQRKRDQLRTRRPGIASKKN
ncbi:hypothetical protein J6590_089691 [Homalodisca vitripennis]|nr:hypothetical protein J6590_089691 [Homalodisca vitripennis]